MSKNYDISVFVLAGVVVLSLMAKFVLKPIQDQPQVTNIIFPAYEVENPENDSHIDDINKAMPFKVDMLLLENWKISKEAKNENTVGVNLYCPYYILNENDETVATVSFDIFDMDENASREECVTAVLEKNICFKNYETVRTMNEFEVGICTVVDESMETFGILALDKTMNSYVAVIFTPEVLDRDTAIQIALHLNFSAQ